MTEVLFYHLRERRLEQALPPLLEKCLERGWKVVVQGTSEERLAALDAHLWTYDDEAFLPHGLAPDRDAARQPIVLTVRDDNPNGADVRFVVEGAPLGDVSGYRRAVVLFDGEDEAAVEAARASWGALKAAGHAVTYWQQDEAGRWRQQG